MSDLSVQTLLVVALGGEGGGVLAEWIVASARRAGRAVQSTSVPGVAQRTGATSYYIEWSRETMEQELTAPVFALSPVPGCVDVVVSSELLETARMMERGFVTPERTCLISSISRTYTTTEKLHMSDGRFDAERIKSLTKVLAKKAVLLDMNALTEQHNTVVSAIMFGSLSGAGVLPWSIDICETVIRESGKGVESSLAGFHAAKQLPIEAQFLEKNIAFSTLTELGAARCIDYQDAHYAQQYRRWLNDAVPPSMEDARVAKMWSEAARHLALWMCYEDVIRVADLKTRPERFERVRQEAQAKANEIVRITEHFKPGVEEIASILPRKIGQWLLSSALKNDKQHFYVGLHIRSTSFWGYLMLRLLAKMRPWRRGSLRFQQEHEAMAAWWAALQQIAPRSAQMGLALAGLPQVLKGYGDTLKRGRNNYEQIWNECVVGPLTAPQDLEQAAARLNKAIQDALASPDAPISVPSKSHPIKWFEKNPNKYRET